MKSQKKSRVVPRGARRAGEKELDQGREPKSLSAVEESPNVPNYVAEAFWETEALADAVEPMAMEWGRARLAEYAKRDGGPKVFPNLRTIPLVEAMQAAGIGTEPIARPERGRRP